MIVGWSKAQSPTPKILFEYAENGKGDPTLKNVDHINAYLVAGPDIFVLPRTQALGEGLPHLTNGNKPADGKNLTVRDDEYEAVSADARAAKYLRPFIGARELLYGTQRWCLWLTELTSDDLKHSPLLRQRLQAVREFRLKSTKQLTRDGAETPGLFQQIRQPEDGYLAIPRHVGQSRRFFPVQRYPGDVIAGDHNFVVDDADGYVFSLLSSSMFIAWMKGIAGRLRADPRFSGTGVWNTFPLPEVSPGQKTVIIEAGQAVLRARSEVGGSLDELYDPDNMKPILIRAHRSLDRSVDQLFMHPESRRPLDNADRLSLLFMRFAEISARSSTAIP